MFVGLDFGTTNSVISFWNEDRVEVFYYGGQTTIPTALAYGYQEGAIAVGEEALTAWENNDNLTLRRFFKTDLTSEVAETVQNAKQDCQNFIHKILIDQNNEYSFVRNKGQITRLVVSAPELWQKDVNNRGTNNLLEAIRGLNLVVEHNRTFSEPLAALAYFCWQQKLRQRQNPGMEGIDFEQEKRILVCDMGGGTNDISYCTVQEMNGKINIDVVIHDGTQGRSGVYDLQKILEAFYERCNRADEIGSHAFECDIWGLDHAIKINSTMNRIKQYYESFQRGETDIPNILHFKGEPVHAEDIYSVFPEIQQDIISLLDRIRVSNQGELQFDYLLLIGGFSNYFLVRKTILDYFGLQEDDQKVQALPINDSRTAVAHGAALLAADQISIREKYPHQIVVHTYLVGDYQCIPVTIIEFGTYFNPNEIYWAETTKGRVVFKPDANDNTTTISGYIVKNGTERYEFKKPVSIDYANNNNSFHLGIRMNYSGIAHLILQAIDGSGIQREIYIGHLF